MSGFSCCEGPNYFLNNAWFAVSPDSDQISSYQLIIMYCLYVRIGSISESIPLETKAEIFTDAAEEILRFLSRGRLEVYHFADLQTLVEQISGTELHFLLPKTRDEAVPLVAKFVDLDFYDYLELCSEGVETYAVEPPSSGFQDRENHIASPDRDPSTFPQRDILSDITAECGNNESLSTKATSSLLGSPFQFSKEDPDDTVEFNSDWDDWDESSEVKVTKLVHKLKKLFPR